MAGTAWLGPGCGGRASNSQMACPVGASTVPERAHGRGLARQFHGASKRKRTARPAQLAPQAMPPGAHRRQRCSSWPSWEKCRAAGLAPGSCVTLAMVPAGGMPGSEDGPTHADASSSSLGTASGAAIGCSHVPAPQPSWRWAGGGASPCPRPHPPGVVASRMWQREASACARHASSLLCCAMRTCGGDPTVSGEGRRSSWLSRSLDASFPERDATFSAHVCVATPDDRLPRQAPPVLWYGCPSCPHYTHRLVQRLHRLLYVSQLRVHGPQAQRRALQAPALTRRRRRLLPSRRRARRAGVHGVVKEAVQVVQGGRVVAVVQRAAGAEVGRRLVGGITSVVATCRGQALSPRQDRDLVDGLTAPDHVYQLFRNKFSKLGSAAARRGILHSRVLLHTMSQPGWAGT